MDSLTKNLVRGGKKLFGFEDYSELQYDLLTRKGVYSYEYVNSWDRFNETQLPPVDVFYSNLNMSSISEEDYQLAQQVWKEFGIRDLGDYHDLYLRTDVILLANLYEAFRDTCLKHYKLDPAHFYTSPGLTWKACLKHTGIRLQLVTDPDMLLMFERGIRGGITQAVRKYASANNKYMGDRFDLKSESSYFQYLDANNLYSWAMSQPLPTGGFKWIDVNPNKISELATRTDKGYLLEVDVSYPKELHKKDFSKLMNNSVFGKTMENIRKHRNINLVMTEEKYLHTVMKPNFKSGVLFGENLMGCEMGKIKVVMNKPVYLGQVILDLSKIVMYEFHYDYMVLKYGLEKLKLCYMDTDSLVYDIKTEDFYEDIANDAEARFDTSGYSKTDFRPLPIGLNKKVIGLMKDELGGKIMTEFVALRPKLYSYKS